MIDIISNWADNHLDKSKEELSKILDAEVERFSSYMANLGDWRSAGPLSEPERALIKTYLIQKLKGTLDNITEAEK